MQIRPATHADLPAVVSLVAEAPTEVSAAQEAAFDAIGADPRNELWVGEEDGAVVACLQVTYIPGLGRGGAERALIEAVRVREDRRGSGLGAQLVSDAIERARARGCALVQLTSNQRRSDAHRFYTRLGFEPTHVGFKLVVEPADASAGEEGVCAGDAPPLVGDRLTGSGLTLAEAAAAIERGDLIPMTAVQRRLVEAWAVEQM